MLHYSRVTLQSRHTVRCEALGCWTPAISSFEGSVSKGIILLSTAYVLRAIDNVHMGLYCELSVVSVALTFRFSAVQAPSVISLDTPLSCETKAEVALREKFIRQLHTFLLSRLTTESKTDFCKTDVWSIQLQMLRRYSLTVIKAAEGVWVNKKKKRLCFCVSALSTRRISVIMHQLCPAYTLCLLHCTDKNHIFGRCLQHTSEEYVNGAKSSSPPTSKTASSLV